MELINLSRASAHDGVGGFCIHNSFLIASVLDFSASPFHHDLVAYQVGATGLTEVARRSYASNVGFGVLASDGQYVYISVYNGLGPGVAAVTFNGTAFSDVISSYTTGDYEFAACGDGYVFCCATSGGRDRLKALTFNGTSFSAVGSEFILNQYEAVVGGRGFEPKYIDNKLLALTSVLEETLYVNSFSFDGSTFTREVSVVASEGYAITPTGNNVYVDISESPHRYWRLNRLNGLAFENVHTYTEITETLETYLLYGNASASANYVVAVVYGPFDGELGEWSYRVLIVKPESPWTYFGAFDTGVPTNIGLQVFMVGDYLIVIGSSWGQGAWEIACFEIKELSTLSFSGSPINGRAPLAVKFTAELI